MNGPDLRSPGAGNVTTGRANGVQLNALLMRRDFVVTPAAVGTNRPSSQGKKIMTALKSPSALKATGIEARCAATGMRMTETAPGSLRACWRRLWIIPTSRNCIAAASRSTTRYRSRRLYRTVQAVSKDAGIIERHDFRGGPRARARYEQMRDSHHDHLINLRDGKVIEFTSEEIEEAAGRNRPQARLQSWSITGWSCIASRWTMTNPDRVQS